MTIKSITGTDLTAEALMRLATEADPNAEHELLCDYCIVLAYTLSDAAITDISAMLALPRERVRDFVKMLGGQGVSRTLLRRWLDGEDASLHLYMAASIGKGELDYNAGDDTFKLNTKGKALVEQMIERSPDARELLADLKQKDRERIN